MLQKRILFNTQMGIIQTKSSELKIIEKQLTSLANQVNDIQYDLNHTSDINFRHSIKNRNIFKLTQKLLAIQELIEKDDILELISTKKRTTIQIQIDDIAWKIQQITTHK
jgi:hypothetical protein